MRYNNEFNHLNLNYVFLVNHKIAISGGNLISVSFVISAT